MIEMYTPFKWTLIGAAGFLAVADPVSAQDAMETATVAPMATATTSAATPRQRGSATPEMIEEAIQRSLARSEKARTQGRPEQFGSEEPFTFRR
jgi:hypothetical protein